MPEGILIGIIRFLALSSFTTSKDPNDGLNIEM